MVESIVTVVLEVVKCLAPPTQRQLDYLRNYNENIQKLEAETESLKVEIRSIERRVFGAEKKGEKSEEKVEKWLVSANKIIDEVNAKFMEDEETATKRCLKGLCPNLKARYQLSKKAETQVKALVECREEAGRLDRISYLTYPDKIWLKSHKGYEAFGSRLSTLKCIQNALTDVNVSIVGVYGMGGVGKTTLAKEIVRQALADKLFDQITFSEVSETVDIKKIQRDIAEDLGLAWHEETESRTASRLYEQLKNEKKILVVLDNIWKHLDLETVGIPFGDDYRGCKLLLTARDRNVLLDMDSKHNFFIDNLNEEEAWRLFKTMAGDYVENRQLKSTATDVAKGCGGLPIALATTARAMRDKTVHEWKNALRELQTPSVMNFEGLPADTYSRIELSFKYLKGEQLKKIFLLCSLMGNSIFTSDLFKYSMGLGILQGVKKMEDARNQLYALAYKLKDACLLLEGGSNEQFSMHDVVRDVGISIACRDQHVFLAKNEDVLELPDKEALENCFAISITGCRIQELPQGLECLQLEFLYVSPKDSYLQINIPENFFAGMRKLRVVDFTGMQLYCLPSSIDLLVNLQTLCLDQCMLGDIAIIGRLKNLEILSFLKSDIVQLPEELRELTKLRLLDLSNCLRLKVIAPNVLSSLTRLEELYMKNCFIEWEVESPNSGRCTASLVELLQLPRLTTLEIDVKNDSILPEGFFAKKLERFKISIGDESFKPPVLANEWFRSRRLLISNPSSLRTIKLKLSSKPICSKKMQGIQNAEYLCLDKLQGVNNVLFDMDTEGFLQLKHLHVQNNPEFSCVVDSTERVSRDAFPLLESLTLYNLINMERVCTDRLKVESFCELKTIKLGKCDELSNIFLLSSTSCLPRLERIAVFDCDKIEEVFAIGGEPDVDNYNTMEQTEFAALKCLHLRKLPKLESFCSEVKRPNTQESQEELTAITCSNEISLLEEDKLDTSTPLFKEKVVLPSLEDLKLVGINVEKIWQNQLPAMFLCFQSLTKLIVGKCHKLKCIFSTSMLRSFEQLRQLNIYNCMGLLEIISEGADQVPPCFIFPRLTFLRLRKLPELRCLYPGMHTSEWPALKMLKVFGCDKIKLFGSELSSFHGNIDKNQLHIPAQQPLLLIEKIFPSLEKLLLSGKDFRMILQGDYPQNLFGSLKYIKVADDDSACFPLGLLEKFQNLEILFLSCTSYTEILSNEGHSEKHVGKFSQVKHLQPYKLNDLKHLWKQDSKLDSILANLEILRVYCCQNLTVLLPSSSVSFWNLTDLQVWGCKKLMNLVTSSTAKSLVRLMTMKVCGSKAMTQVVVSEEDGAEDEIVFSKLKTLSLLDLDSLTSFYSGNYTFKFPSLQDLEVIGCPKMKIFTTGELCTPPRVNVWYGEGDGECRWANDLNGTVRELHAEKDVESKILFYEICVPCIKSLHAEGLPVLSLLFYLCFTSLCRYSFLIASALVSATKRGLMVLSLWLTEKKRSQKIQKLNAEIDNLKVESRSNQHGVSEVKRKGEKIEDNVKKWEDNANMIIDEAEKFIGETTTENQCLKGLCPNLKTRYQLSKKAETQVKALDKCREEAGRLDRIPYLTYPDKTWLKSHKGYEAFGSRLSTFRCIQNVLTDVNVSIVGVYGMAGIGKTMLVKEVARRAWGDKLFDQVVFSEVSETVDIKTIQRDIAEDLGLPLLEETESRIASRLTVWSIEE
ncbi:Disease resistance protein [Citrus sinensis]|nr:Disease resistance protein [Citrus sinensis]